MQKEINSCHHIIRELKETVTCNVPFSQLQNDEHVKFYTGLPTAKVVQCLFDFVAPAAKTSNTKLTAFQ